MTHVTDGADFTQPGGAYSQAVIAGSLISVAGQTGIDPATGELKETLEEQVEQAIRNVESVLRACGATLSDLVKTSCFLPEITRFADFDAVYRRLVPAPWPTRSTIGTPLAPPLQFEIEAWALLPDGKR